MIKPEERIRVTSKTSLANSLDENVDAPNLLERKGKVYRIVEELSNKAAQSDQPKEYDPEKTRAVWLGAIGILKGVDNEKLKAGLREQRGQDSSGRNDLEYIGAKLNN